MKSNNNLFLFFPMLIVALFMLLLFLLSVLFLKNIFTREEIKKEEYDLVSQKEKFDEYIENFKQREKAIFDLARGMESGNLSINTNSRDKDLLLLLSQLERQEAELNSLKNDFNKAKQKILDLNFLQGDTILELQARLDANISLDSQSGAMTIRSDYLFNDNSYTLKSEAKPKLHRILSEYFNAILEDDYLKGIIQNIIIEVHSSSDDSSFMYKLDLTHKRVYELASFIQSFYKNDSFKKLLLISGKSFSQPIYTNGVEDEVASNRIKIYFTVSNEAIIEKFEEFFH